MSDYFMIDMADFITARRDGRRPRRGSPPDTDLTCGVYRPALVHGHNANFVTKLRCADPCDFDLDGDVDLVALARFQACFRSTFGGDPDTCASGCDVFDVDHSLGVHLPDFAALAPLLTGPQ